MHCIGSNGNRSDGNSPTTSELLVNNCNGANTSNGNRSGGNSPLKLSDRAALNSNHSPPPPLIQLFCTQRLSIVKHSAVQVSNLLLCTFHWIRNQVLSSAVVVVRWPDRWHFYQCSLRQPSLLASFKSKQHSSKKSTSNLATEAFWRLHLIESWWSRWFWWRYTQGNFFNWYPPKKLKYVKPRIGVSMLT